MFFSIWLGKKNEEVTEFLEIFKKTFPGIKKYVLYFIYFTYSLNKKRNVLLNKKVISVFHTIFKLDFMM